MTITMFSLILGSAAIGAGFLGSLTGLGGGIIIVPLLTLVFGVDIHYAIGTSLITVIATSSGAATAFAKDGYAKIRAGMFLEIGATLGALAGTMVTAVLSPSLVAVIFGAVLMYSALSTLYHKQKKPAKPDPGKLPEIMRMNGSYPTPTGQKQYALRYIPGGLAVTTIGGILSGILGIGSGAIKVIAMDQIMQMPFKVSAATSNFMIGVTAAAGAGIYLHKGYIDPGLAVPVMLGVLAGSLVGGRLLTKAKTSWLRVLFAVTIAILGFEMIRKGFTGNF